VLDLDPQKLRQFLFDHVETHEELQILMWFQQHSGSSATEGQIAADTGISTALVTEALERLTAAGMLASHLSTPGAFHYDPKEPAVHEMLQRVVAIYREDPRSVIELMTANALQRLRASASRAFADAFRLRKRKDDDDG
jgi:hypothetical protein